MNNVLEYLEQSAERFPDKTAIIDRNVSITYQELKQICQGAGTGLTNQTGIGRPVAVLMEKGIPAITAFWGIVYAGGCYPVQRLFSSTQRW